MARTTLSKASVGRLALKWKTQIDKEVLDRDRRATDAHRSARRAGRSHPAGGEDCRLHARGIEHDGRARAATGASIGAHHDNTVSQEVRRTDLHEQSTATP